MIAKWMATWRPFRLANRFPARLLPSTHSMYRGVCWFTSAKTVGELRSAKRRNRSRVNFCNAEIFDRRCRLRVKALNRYAIVARCGSS
jgi:hypothetical protein